MAERQPSRPAITPMPPTSNAAPVAHTPLCAGQRVLLLPPLGEGWDGGTGPSTGSGRWIRPVPPPPPSPGGGGSKSRFSPSRIVSGVNGGALNLTPVASKIAFAIAAVPGTDDDSPAPSEGS